jgi:hypothetical protein
MVNSFGFLKRGKAGCASAEIAGAGSGIFVIIGVCFHSKSCAANED